MFPDMRLTIGALVASIIALVSGFAVFAALRVNHAPLARLLYANARLQLLTGNVAPAPVATAAAGLVDHWLDSGARRAGNNATDAQALDRDDTVAHDAAASAPVSEPRHKIARKVSARPAAGARVAAATRRPHARSARVGRARQHSDSLGNR